MTATRMIEITIVRVSDGKVIKVDKIMVKSMIAVMTILVITMY